MITIYSSPTCSKCVEIKEFCKNSNINFEEKDITKDFKAKAKLISKGLMGLPVVEINNEFYNEDLDFIKDKILGANND